MVTLLSLLLLAQLATPAQERPARPDSPPVEVLDAEVNTYAIQPRNVPDRRGPPPAPGPISSSDDIPGRGTSARAVKPSVARRSTELGAVDSRGRRPPAAGEPSSDYRYEYRLRVKNVGSKKVTSLLWEYRPIDPSGASVNSRRLILCEEALKPGESKRLRVWTPLAPVNVVRAETAGDGLLKAEVLVNRVGYADGSAWQRAGWEQQSDPKGGPGNSGRRLRGSECVVW